MNENTVLSSETLSYNYKPGQDKLYQSTNTDSIFTFGDFRIERTINPNIINNDVLGLNFDRLQNLTSLTSSNFNATEVLNVKENELNPNLKNPNSYSYFGSYYTKIANAINNIIDKFPYPILAFDYNTGATNINIINDYYLSQTQITLISSAFTNQGNIIYTSGNSINALSGNTLNLYDNYDKFEIQLSSTTLNTSPSYPIISYSYSAVSTYLHLTFHLAGILTAVTTNPVYIRPSKKRFFQYKRSLSNLEYQLLEEGVFSVPNPDNDIFYDKTIEWPLSIDGFAPDSYGTNFDNYSEEILRDAYAIDELKTNWMIRTIIPENYLDLDTDGQIYKKLVYTYADEFDKIKSYIDNLAYSHSVNYKNTETLPDKFLYRLSQLLGWKQPINFTDTDFFEFLGLEDEENKTLEDYNLDYWRRILTNINWLYKRKGTRDAIMFVFKLIGAPEALIHFDEFIYKIKQNASVQLSTQFLGGTSQNSSVFVPSPLGKVNENGYINYEESIYKFQEGGQGRGNGQNYINQWRPEFDPVKFVDNVKVYTGSSEFYGTENIVNTKEVNIGLDPASAIESDVFDWYKLGYFYTGNSISTIPSDYKVSNVDLVAPPEITGFTISQWLDFVYNNSIDVRTRKTEIQPHNNYFYPNLRKIYLTYYYWNTSGQSSNMITFRKLEQFLRLIESKFFVYLEQLIPATTIFEGVSTIYRNTVFNRQHFIYPKGINDGSEFQIPFPTQPTPEIHAVVVSSRVNNILQPDINSFCLTASSISSKVLNLSSNEVSIEVDETVPLSINAIHITSTIYNTNTLTTTVIDPLIGDVILFPLSGSPIGTPPIIGRRYTGNTASGSVGSVPINPPIS